VFILSITVEVVLWLQLAEVVILSWMRSDFTVPTVAGFGEFNYNCKFTVNSRFEIMNS
jgi:hypothetical protein